MPDTNTDKKHKHTPLRRRLRYVVLLAAIAVAGAGFAGFRLAMTQYEGVAPCRINIPADATAEAVLDTLTSGLGDDFGRKVYKLWQWRNRNDGGSAYGSYVIAPGDRTWAVANRLYKRRQSPVRVTFNNIRLMDDLAARVSANMDFSAADFSAAADSVLPAMGFGNRAEYIAAFVPDTYEFYWSDPADKVIRRLVGVRDEFWTDSRRKQASALGLTPVQVATIASIVEEETRDATDRGMVARLYLNRIKKGMKLQADPTVKFAAGNFAARRITGEMLATDSPYNTYKTTGLPPGPIRMPERATMEIVLNAPRHDFLYMCASPEFDGTHNYATDFASHSRNARAYRAELDRRGIHQ